jgi:hypothetical protein
VEWGGLFSDPEEVYPEKIKTVVSPTDYGKEEVEQGKTFYISNDIKGGERAEYARLLKDYSDVFAWTPHGFGGDTFRTRGACHRPSGGSSTGSTTLVPAQPEVFIDGEGGN